MTIKIERWYNRLKNKGGRALFRKEKVLPLMKFGLFIAIVSGQFAVNDLKSTVEATQVSSSHIGTFKGGTTFIATSESEVSPGLFIEVVDQEGNLTQYESEEGLITIPNTIEGAYVTQAKLLGKTKYKDVDTNEILDEWEVGRNLKLISVKKPQLKMTGKNLFNGKLEIGSMSFSTGEHNPNWSKKYATSLPFPVEPNTDYTFSGGYGVYSHSDYKFVLFDKEMNFIKGTSLQSFTTTSDTAYVKIQVPCLENTIPDNVQLEYGKSPTQFETFKTNQLSTESNIELHGINSVRDSLDLVTGEQTVWTTKITWNGTEDWKIPGNWSLGETTPFALNYSYRSGSSFVADFFKPVTSGLSTLDAEGFSLLSGVRAAIRVSNTKASDVDSFKNWLELNPMTVIHKIGDNALTNKIKIISNYKFETIIDRDVAINGDISPTIISIMVPTTTLSFVLYPNQEKEKQFIAPTFTISNENYAPLTIELKEFEQISNVFNDVSPDYYESWEGLTQEQSKNIALALIPKASDGWVTLNESAYHVANGSNQQIGTIKGKSSVELTFSALHGISFSESLNPQYKLTFVFDLLD